MDMSATDEARNAIKLVMLNGALMPLADARISVMAPGFNYGLQAFEGIRAYRNTNDGTLSVFRLRAHVERLAFTMRVLRFDGPPGVDRIVEEVLETIRANEFRDDCYIRLNTYVDEWGESVTSSPIGTAIIVRPRPRDPGFETGKHFCVSSWRRLSDNAIPPRAKIAGAYVNGRLASLAARDGGFDGAVLLNERGTVSEGPGGCIFIVRGGTLITPGVTSGILESITRETLMVLGPEEGIPATERDIDRTELYAAAEMFYCGTGQEITPIVSIDRLPIGDGTPGPVTRALQRRYDAVVRGTDGTHPEWRTPVY